MVVQFVGTCVLGYVMGDVASMLRKEDVASSMIKEKIEALNAYMSFRKLPKTIIKRIRQRGRPRPTPASTSTSPRPTAPGPPSPSSPRT